MDKDVAEEGMVAAVEETAAAAPGTPMEAVLRTIARLLGGPWPEGVETIADPIEET